MRPRDLIHCLLLVFAIAPIGSIAATFTVTTTSDSGPGSLRQAIVDANTAPGFDTIAFNIPGGGPHSILPLSNLPGLTGPILIDGYTQPGASPNTAGIGSNAQIRIALVGPGDFSVSALALLVGSTGSTVRGLAINRFGGSQINAIGEDCVLTGNFIGLDPGGTIAYPSAPGTRIGVSVIGNRCRLGGTARADRNVVSGHSGSGVYVAASDARVQGNLIGTDRTGGAALGNACGITVGNASVGGNPTLNNLIGGDNFGTSTPRNVISGNTRCGIEIVSGEGLVIEGNFIGLAAFPIATIPNAGPGILVRGASRVRIGFAIAGEISNSIVGNDGEGVLVSGSAAVAPQGIGIFGNAIFGNGGLPIDLALDGATGVTPNDPLDADSGPNGLQNFPELTSVTLDAGGTRIDGRLQSEPSSSYFIDFYAAATCDPSGHGGSSAYLGFVPVTTNASGIATFNPVFADAPTTGFASATATRNATVGPTSEYARCIRLGDVLFANGFDP